MRIAINGMGRIGRLLLRKLINIPGIDVIAVNDIMPSENLSYLLKYDSIYGPFPFNINYQDHHFEIQDHSIRSFNESSPKKLPWEALQIDIVLECSGRFITHALASQHLEAGAKKVILSTTGTEDIPLFIYGFNQKEIHSNLSLFSPGGCMTNCTTPLIDILQPLGIESLQLNVIHSYTSRQELVDGPHQDFRRGRAATESIIPVPVDLALSLDRLFPDLAGSIATLTTRVPVANGAIADFSFQLKQKVTIAEINNLFRYATNQKYHNIVAYTEEPLVSLDVKGNSHSAIIDGSLTSVVGNQVKIMALFDNEWGYTSRILDWIQLWSFTSNE